MHNKNKFKEILALTRWTEAYDFSITLALFGCIAGGGSFDFKLILVLFATFFSALFTFMINDVEDAEEDAQNPKKFKRNPVAHEGLTKREGYFYTCIAMFISLGLFSFLSIITGNFLIFSIGLSTIILGFLYSWRKIRLKAIPILDVLAHMFMFSGGLFLGSYFVYKQNLEPFGLFVFLLICGVSAYGELDNETRDYETDIKTKVNTTATLLGLKASSFLKWAILGLCIIAFTWLIIFSHYLNFSSAFILFLIATMLIGVGFAYFRFKIHKDQKQFERELNQSFILMGNINLLIYFFKIFI